jgi:hypothetical protein
MNKIIKLNQKEIAAIGGGCCYRREDGILLSLATFGMAVIGAPLIPFVYLLILAEKLMEGNTKK